MADPNGETTDSLMKKLETAPQTFDFFAAVRRIQSHFHEQPRIGRSLSPKHDPVRFGQSPFLEFAPSTLEAFQMRGDEKPPAIFSRHFGLFGPNGPLPLCLTEYARDRILHHGDKTFAAFCNVFHHRLFSFFFRAWADARKVVDFDRSTDQHWRYFIGGLTGLGMESLLHRDSIPDRAKFYYSGRLSNQTRNAEGLEAIIQDFFQVKTQLQTFVGRWLTLPPDSICRLGETRRTGSLGSSVIVGTRIWSCQMSFRLRMGPMKLAAFHRLLPSSPSSRRLTDWVKLYSGEEFTWDVQLVLAKEEVPSTQLGRSAQLGWTTWLKTQPFEKDSEDVVLSFGS
ncbi:MAG TPA: type VI secretion system baseplate subunit TssG [Verrucomicrobiae bacterium]|nr:type VI secretion system baseplate subunit TssG [Verrucomicrobiae bacterium]